MRHASRRCRIATVRERPLRRNNRRVGATPSCRIPPVALRDSGPALTGRDRREVHPEKRFAASGSPDTSSELSSSVRSDDSRPPLAAGSPSGVSQSFPWPARRSLLRELLKTQVSSGGDRPICFFGSSRRERSGFGPSVNLSERHSHRVPVSFYHAIARPRPSDSFGRPPFIGSRRGSIWRLATPMWPEQAPPAPDSRSSDPLDRSELRWSEPIATKIASRLVLEGAGYGRYDSGDSLPESPVIHTTVRFVTSGRSFGTLLCSQEPWSRSPPGCSHPVDASGREVRPGKPASDHGYGRLCRHTGKERDSSANPVIPSSRTWSSD